MNIVIDTETCPIDTTLTEVRPENMWSYDIGWAVVDDDGSDIVVRSFVNADIFLGEKEAMKSAFFADKIPQYWEDIKAGRRILTSFYNIRKAFLEDVKKYNVKQVFAHNMRFDYGTLNQTQRWLTKSKYRFFFPFDVEICDTLKMAKQIFSQMEEYKTFCSDNGYMTKNNKMRYTAEILFRFISNQNDFVESHTALEDVMIEKEILAYCLRMNPNVKKCLWD